MRLGRHGGMTSSELEMIITRNGNFLTVIRAGDGDGQAGLYNSITGNYLGGIGGGWIPEHSTHRDLDYGCPCNEQGKCRTGAHGRYLIRGWKNICYELMVKGHISGTKEIRRLLGDEIVWRIQSRGLGGIPGIEPNQTDTYASL